MKRIILLVIIFSVFLTGCSQYSQLGIGDIHFRSLKFKGTSTIEIKCDMEVDNPSKYTIAMEKLDAAIYKEGKVFAVFELVDTPEVPPMTEAKTDITLQAGIADPLAIITTGLDFNNWNTADFTIHGKIILTSDGKYKKAISLNHVPLDKVLSYIK